MEDANDGNDERLPTSLTDTFAKVQELRQASMKLSPEERQLRKDLKTEIGRLARRVRREPHVVAALTHARQMLNDLNLPTVNVPSQGGRAVRGEEPSDHRRDMQAWEEIREKNRQDERSRPKYGRAPKTGIRTVTRGGMPGSGKRR